MGIWQIIRKWTSKSTPQLQACPAPSKFFLNKIELILNIEEFLINYISTIFTILPDFFLFSKLKNSSHYCVEMCNSRRSVILQNTYNKLRHNRVEMESATC